MEVPCLRSALANGGLKWEGELLATYHVARKTLERVVEGHEDISAYAIHRQALHETLLSPCSNTWMLGSWRLLYTQNLRYRHTFQALSSFELELSGDFKHFIDHVLARDIEAAVQACLENYEKLADFIDGSKSKGRSLPSHRNHRLTGTHRPAKRRDSRRDLRSLVSGSGVAGT